MISITVSLGELADRLAILRIKEHMIKEEKAHSDVKKDLDDLQFAWDSYVETLSIHVPELLLQMIYSINLSLWYIEDEIRKKEGLQQFDREFVELARSVYVTNDERNRVKNEISQLDPCQGTLEHKKYVDY